MHENQFQADCTQNVKEKKITFLEDNLGEWLHDFWIGKDFLNRQQDSQTIGKKKKRKGKKERGRERRKKGKKKRKINIDKDKIWLH